MGNCFGKTSDKNFQGEGRTLGSAPAHAPPSTKTGSSAVPKITSPQGGRTLGKNAQTPKESQAPREAAARAAEERVKVSQGSGKLGKQLEAQKALSRSDILAQTARDKVAARDADAAQEARTWN